MSTDTDSDTAITAGVARADRVRDRRVRRTLFGCAAITVVTTLAIFAVLVDNGFSYFYGVKLHEAVLGATLDQQVSLTEFVTGTRWAPDHARPSHGILPIVYGTLAITVGSAFVSIPIGTATAIYLSEYASPGVRSKLKPTLEVLAGIPTIVYGFFAISFVTPFFISPAGDLLGYNAGRYNLLAGCIVVGVMTIPMVSSLSEDAMSAVPDDLRNAAYGLGATKFDVSLRVVLPASISGVFASYILAVSRAIGETMAVTLAAGQQAQITGNPFNEIMTMTAYMVSMARGESAVGTVEYQSLFAVGMVLFVMTLTMNLINDWIKRRYREVYQ
ncbi:phosphate ABC transporter permease subunit PstC [Natronobiforma cellulositropha]|uniref:phosphate ABC transporter permease subunit PstC n=1 Tax=Natronobiforma cellulositropha TaxID=1679076 RepID=UPI0021D5F60F|nr:phosphate ABC transporter permease subunit PstC [Natronobiforma cellulositropha]